MNVTRMLPIVVVLACCQTGCRDTSMWFERATLYADTRTADKDGFTNKSPQHAYDGELVTFDFQSDLAVSDYALFMWPGGKPDVLSRKDLVNTYFRGVGVFKAGAEPRRNLVQAVAYAVRGESDWYYDEDQKKWVSHIMADDERDMVVGKSEMEIICYRVELDIPFRPGARRVKEAALHFLKNDGSRSTVHIRVPPSVPGFELIGPDASGRYRVRYAPTWKEVNRVGTTRVELLLTYDDGTQETITRTVDTP